jgi:hypothetical protein
MAHYEPYPAKLISGALPKRVQSGARVHVTLQEYSQFMELWELSDGRPSRDEIEKLSRKLGRYVLPCLSLYTMANAHNRRRCRKQIAVWFSNRRQNLVEARRRVDRPLTHKEKMDIVWSKYRPTTAEIMGTTRSPSTKSMSPVPSMSSKSSSAVSECFTPEAVTPDSEACTCY